MCKTRANGHGSLKKYAVFCKSCKKVAKIFMSTDTSYLIFVNIFSKMEMLDDFRKTFKFHVFSTMDKCIFVSTLLFRIEKRRQFSNSNPWSERPIVFCKFNKYQTTYVPTFTPYSVNFSQLSYYFVPVSEA